MTGTSLINLGELSKPAVVLIEKISNAIGVVYEPTRIKRKAKANAEASIIQAKTNLEISDLEKRGLERLVYNEARKQKNIESITAKAIKELPEHTEVENLDEDWLVEFFEKCSKISDEKMQTLWSRVLAGEATRSNSFSKRTLNTIALLSKNDANTITEFGQFVWTIGESTPIIFGWKEEIYNEIFPDFLQTLNHLSSLGIISLEYSSNQFLYLPESKQDASKKYIMHYFDNSFEIKFKPENNYRIILGSCLFTTTGQELFKICGAKPNDKFKKYVIEKFKDQGIQIIPK